MADPIQAPCKRDFFPAAHNSGKRDIKKVIWIVMHDEEASNAQSAASWFKNPNSGGSAHLCVDDNVCYRCLENDDIPWGAPGANEEGFHIEQSGFARWSAVLWKSHLKTLQRAAYKAALHCKVFKIPPVFVDYKGVQARKPGITTHAEITKAFPALAAKYGSHTDPGPFWPRPLFMWYVNKYYKQLL